jgi:hypothetical protein
MILFLSEPELMQEIAIRANSTGAPMHELERAELGFDYCDVGGRIAAAWGLPGALETVLACHQVPAATERYQLETSIVHIAYMLARTEPGSLPTLDPVAVSVAACTPEAAGALRAGAAETIKAATATFGTLSQAA